MIVAKRRNRSEMVAGLTRPLLTSALREGEKPGSIGTSRIIQQYSPSFLSSAIANDTRVAL